MRYSTWSLIVVFSSLLAFTPPAVAVDGVVLIHQGTSVNGLPGCPHVGFPIVICHSGSYRLAGSLDIPAVNIGAIAITADNVTLDLNGFAVSGPADCSGGTYPVQCVNVGFAMGVFSDGRNTTVRNGTVRGFGSGVFLGSDGSLIDSVHAESNSDASVGAAGIFVSSGIVTHCTSTANAGDGIRAGEPFQTTVSLNTVSFNGGFGIIGGGSVSNNTVSANGQDGIHNAASALYNTLATNIGFGITDDSPKFGYLGNVMLENRGGMVFGGQSLGHNLCNGVAC